MPQLEVEKCVSFAIRENDSRAVDGEEGAI
jgi:hypothetical protein